LTDVGEINTELIRGEGISAGALLMDLDNNERNRRLNDISKVSISYLTEQLDDVVRKNILLRPLDRLHRHSKSNSLQLCGWT
jgi:hypothetical protein